MLVEPLGVFGDTPQAGHTFSREALTRLRDVLPEDLRADVARYLRSGTVILAFMEYTEDILERAFDCAGGSGIMSDGTWYWRSDAAEYVAHYGIGIPEGALDLMRSRGWQAPEVTSDQVADIHDFLSLARGARPARVMTFYPSTK